MNREVILSPKTKQGAREKAQSKRHCLLSYRSWVWLPVPTCWLVSTCNSISKKSDALFWSLQAPGIHVVHWHTQRQNTHTYKIKLKRKQLPTKLKIPNKTVTFERTPTSIWTIIAFSDWKQPLLKSCQGEILLAFPFRNIHCSSEESLTS